MLATRVPHSSALTTRTRSPPAAAPRRRAPLPASITIAPARARGRADDVAMARAAGNGDGAKGSSSIDGDSDHLYVAKLAALSFAGAAAIKYGSQLVALPHEPSAAVALAAVLGTPVAYSAWLLVRR